MTAGYSRLPKVLRLRAAQQAAERAVHASHREPVAHCPLCAT